MSAPTKESIVRRRAACRRRRRGGALVYGLFSIVAISGVISLAVDYGRVQLARTQLQTAADTAARYAASGVKHEIDGVNAAQGMARAVLAENTVDNAAIKDSEITVEVGQWNATSHSFTANSNVNVANAVRVTLTASDSDSTSIPLTFGKLIGRSTQSLTTSAIALYDADHNLASNATATSSATYQQRYVPATSNLWLAGNRAGVGASFNNPHNSPDYAGDSSNSGESPMYFDGLTVSPGSTITFDGVNGGANNSHDAARYTGDGNTAQVVSDITGPENGKGNVLAPINSVIAVFLGPTEPTGTANVPASLDFSTAASRDFATLTPQLNQPFFIGDGRRDNGDLQQFVIPAGATRLFVGTMDSYEWNNNSGGFTVTATASSKVVIVK